MFELREKGLIGDTVANAYATAANSKTPQAKTIFELFGSAENEVNISPVRMEAKKTNARMTDISDAPFGPAVQVDS